MKTAVVSKKRKEKRIQSPRNIFFFPLKWKSTGNIPQKIVHTHYLRGTHQATLSFLFLFFVCQPAIHSKWEYKDCIAIPNYNPLHLDLNASLQAQGNFTRH